MQISNRLFASKNNSSEMIIYLDRKMSSSKEALVVGLGGVTNGGKTTMCQSLVQIFSSDRYEIDVKILHLDDYFRPNDDPKHKHLKKFNHHDWDCLEALDIDRFLQDFQSVRLRCDLLLVEGFLIFNLSSKSNQEYRYDFAYYFDLPYEECRKRRGERHYDPPDPKGYFEEHVWQAFINAKKQVLDQDNDGKLQLIDTTQQSFEIIQDKIVREIETALKQRRKMT